MPDSHPESSADPPTGVKPALSPATRPDLRRAFALPMPAATMPAPPPPLQGITLLAVEDSRFASEALRLMCQRAGARLRRAETLAVARQHLRVYQPDAVIIDLGLPDGPGEGLIAELAAARGRPRLLLATSGDPAGAPRAAAAGADAFLEKPLESYAAFRAALARLERYGGLDAGQAGESGFGQAGTSPASLSPDPLAPDPLALSDDLRHAARLVATGPDAQARRYLRGFLGGIARHSRDMALAEAVRGAEGAGGMDRLARLLSRRLGEGAAAFPRAPQGGR